MFYRTTMTLAFATEDEARDFFHDGELALPKAHTINPGQDEEERGHILLEKCYHDKHPAMRCDILAQDWTPD